MIHVPEEGSPPPMTGPVFTQCGLGFADSGQNRGFKAEFTCLHTLFILAASFIHFLVPGTTVIYSLLNVELCS